MYDPCVDFTGSKIAYVARLLIKGSDIPLYGLRLYDLESGEDRALYSSANSARLFSPVFSNDGEQLAYVVERDGKLLIRVRDLTTDREPRSIGFGSSPSWRQDDRAIFYSSRDTADAPSGDLMVHELKTGLNQSLALRGNSFTNLPRGTSVAYTALPYSRRNDAVWVIDANSRQTRLSSPGKAHRDTGPVHINGTKFVAFTRTDVATNKSAIYVVERFAEDPVEALLFEAEANTYTKGGHLLR